MTGLDMVQSEDPNYAYNSGAGTLSIEERSDDLGSGYDNGWVGVTRDVLNRPGGDINMVMWSWCGGVHATDTAGISAYLSAMSQLETEFPNVVFVYMTGHLEGTGPTGGLNVRNNQIRKYCQDHDKILYDFADVETYDPAGTAHAYDSDGCGWCTTWCASHTCPSCGDCAHSHCFNCYRKGKAFWWMMARIAGWDGQ